MHFVQMSRQVGPIVASVSGAIQKGQTPHVKASAASTVEAALDQFDSAEPGFKGSGALATQLDALVAADARLKPDLARLGSGAEVDATQLKSDTGAWTANAQAVGASLGVSP
jgi:hypothetical protein